MSELCKNNCGCSGKTETAPETKETKRQIKIEFLYLDLDECDPCRDSETNVTDALEEIANVLRATGVEIILERIHVESLEQALALGFKTSPTILINGKDLQLNFEEAYCQSCSELSGTETNCRVWDFHGAKYESLPKALLIEAVLKAIFGTKQAQQENQTAGSESFLKNLKGFFDSKNRRKQPVTA